MEFQCNVCAKNISRNADLKRNKEFVHGTGAFSCDKCFKTFNGKDAYVRHERTCSIICKYCDTEFDSGSDLSIHVQSQHSDKKYMCSECGKEHSQKQELRKHQQKCTNTVNDFILRTIINYIKSGVKCIRQYKYIFYGLVYTIIKLF